MDWQSIETAPKDRIIRLNATMMGHHIDLTGWWLPGMEMWTSGGMSLFEADGWMEPNLKDGLRIAREIVMGSYVPTPEHIDYRNHIAELLDEAIDKQL